ncbi:UDP-glucose/GDP-mannose dehydrogenase family protein [Candidatus Woesearchaeota archaeon]|nr:UDP-glucose/GDP-mannose dehydrogenase family protein [Candidatus Woesearchaeota archaeon]
MKIAIFGTGYVGLVTGTCFADLGNDVICVDIDEKKISMLKAGKVPIYEPGLEPLIKRNVAENRLVFTTDAKHAVEESDIIFICVGTPQADTGEADLSYVKSAAASIGKYMNGYKVIVDKSTVPVETSCLVKDIIEQNLSEEGLAFDVASNPEFLKEGNAIDDFKVPDRIVVGVNSDRARKVMERLYAPFVRANKPLVFVKVSSAEIIKYGANGLLATKISYMNMLSHLCEKTGADVMEVARGIGLDNRIGPRFLHAGIGYGGSCFPKDVRALVRTLKKFNCRADILEAVDSINEEQKKSLLPKIEEYLNPLPGKKIAVWGLAFKPKTDDIRESPALVIIKTLLERNAKVSAFDPEAMENTKAILPDITYCSSPYDAVKDADALIICTEWDVFRQADKNKIKGLMRHHFVFDGRNIWDPVEMKELGFRYFGIGRKTNGGLQ